MTTHLDDVPPGVNPALWNEDLVNEDHVAAFARALELSDHAPQEGDASPLSPKSPPSVPADAPEWKTNIHGVSATSDFAPIHQRVKKRRQHSSNQSLGLTYHIIRWPLLGFIFLVICLEFGTYVFIRQIVNVLEWGIAWRGHKGVIRRKLRAAKTYEQWVDAAKEMDDYLDFDEWKTDNEGESYFDAPLVRRVRSTLSRLRAAKDTRGLMEALSICVRPNFAGTESPRVYSETYYGTKRVIEAHVHEVAACLDFVRTSTDVSLEEKRAFYRDINRNYGSSALCLSGGASFAYNSWGVVRAFLDADLLPRVITGTSAGGLVAALVCTHTNDELKQLIRPELADKITACEEPFTTWGKRWWETGARFDAILWARKSMFMTRGSLTFKEAYELTGRALNISVVPSDVHSPTILLNHLTAPNCVIWSAIIASAAVPGILNPIVLMAKDRDGNLKPHNLGGSRFKDGSIREDIPLGSLHTQYNVNFSIVSQCNPHVHLFFFAARGAVGRPVAHRHGKGWRGGFILSALEKYVKYDLSKHAKIIRDLNLMPRLLQTDWGSVFTQKFEGDITIKPTSTVMDFVHILDDPDRDEMARKIAIGKKAAFPVLHMVDNRTKIERAILRGRAECRLAVTRDRPNTDEAEVPRIITPVPIESDADTGFAQRSKKKKEVGLEMAMRRRRGLRRSNSRPEDRTTGVEDTIAVQVPLNDISAVNGGALQPPAGLPRTAYPATITDTFRNIRSSSFFRQPRSLSRFFGSPTTSEDDDDTPGMASEAPHFALDSFDRDSDAELFLASHPHPEDNGSAGTTHVDENEEDEQYDGNDHE